MTLAEKIDLIVNSSKKTDPADQKALSENIVILYTIAKIYKVIGEKEKENTEVKEKIEHLADEYIKQYKLHPEQKGETNEEI